MHDYSNDHRGADAAIAAVLTGLQAAPPATAATAQRGNAEPGANACAANTPTPAATPAAQNAPLSGARARLDIANQRLRGAVDDLERFRRPIHRLRSRMAAADAAERALEVHREAHLSRQGCWLADGAAPDQRPAEPVELLQAEQDLIRCQADSVAARAVIADHERALTEASRHVAAMTAARDDAHGACVLDIVREHIDTRYLPTMLAAREYERNVWNTYDALRAGGDEQTAVAVAQALRNAKGRLATTPTAEPERGKRFLAELRLAPALAQLESE